MCCGLIILPERAPLPPPPEHWDALHSKLSSEYILLQWMARACMRPHTQTNGNRKSPNDSAKGAAFKDENGFTGNLLKAYGLRVYRFALESLDAVLVSATASRFLDCHVGMCVACCLTHAPCVTCSKVCLQKMQGFSLGSLGPALGCSPSRSQMAQSGPSPARIRAGCP